jgi:hypothetical protein
MIYVKYLLVFVITAFIISSCQTNTTSLNSEEEILFSKAKENAIIANNGYRKCLKFVDGWLKEADSETGLIPRNLKGDNYWNAKDAAADNYPFMVLTTAILDREMFEGRMLNMLETEIQLTSRIDAMPDSYSFSKKGFKDDKEDLNSILFGSSEYIKDGLLPLTEWLGPSPWSDRMISILDDIWKHAPIETLYGDIPSTNVELNGEMLQTLSRIYWMTGEEKYLEWAIRLGDYYLVGDNHPTRNFRKLRLRDHGCEIVSGLCELYVTTSFAKPGKREEYKPHIHEMLDRILEVGRNEHGLFYNGIYPVDGSIQDERIADNFGYSLNGFYCVYQIDKIERYRKATIKALNSLNDNYRSFNWENGSSDGYADAIEGALNLYVREPVESTAQWLDSEIKEMWAIQKPSGIIEGWHGDGNFARTTIMYCLWKSQGTTILPWREDVKIGAVEKNGSVFISISAENDWSGKILFDRKRHKDYMNLPYDWPRINQFPEYFTINDSDVYSVTVIGKPDIEKVSGKQLLDGFPFNIAKGEEVKLRIGPTNSH